jgi:hypothetical protein
MELWSFDVETKMLAENQPADRIICYSWSNGDQSGVFTRDDPNAKKMMEWLLTNDNILLINQMIAFDFACICITWPDLFPLIMEKYDKLLVDDIMYREQLYAIAGIVDRRFGVQLEKGGVQLQYELVDNLPLEKWPQEYINYSLSDAVWPIKVWHNQNESMIQYFEIDYVPDSRQQTRAYWCLFLMGKMCGIYTDPDAIRKVEKEFMDEKLSYEPALKAWGIYRENGTTNKKRLQQVVEYAYKSQGKKAPRTAESKTFPEGQIATDKETLEAIDFHILNIKKDHKRCEYYLSNYVEMLKKGIDEPIRVFYGIADTGRTTASPNVQNQSRRYGIRECYIPEKHTNF